MTPTWFLNNLFYNNFNPNDITTKARLLCRSHTLRWTVGVGGFWKSYITGGNSSAKYLLFLTRVSVYTLCLDSFKQVSGNKPWFTRSEYMVFMSISFASIRFWGFKDFPFFSRIWLDSCHISCKQSHNLHYGWIQGNYHPNIRR